MRWGFFLSLFVYCAFVSSCQSSKSVDRGLAPKSLLDPIVGDHTYEEIFAKNTALKRAHSELMPAFSARVTFWNDDLRRAYVRELSGRLRLSADEEMKLAKEELQENETYVVFILQMGTRDRKWNNLNEKRSNWKLSLEDSAASTRVDPERIEVISIKDDANRYFYDSEESYMQLYRVRFPRESIRNLKDFVFHISGLRGSLEFAFQNDSESSRP
jgi:hypothetical protein